MAPRPREQLAACMLRSTNTSWLHRGNSRTCIHDSSVRGDGYAKPFILRVRFLPLGVSLLTAPNFVLLFFCFYAILGGLCAGGSATVLGQHILLKRENINIPEEAEPNIFSARIAAALQAASLPYLPRPAGRNAEPAATRWNVPLAALPSKAALHAVPGARNVNSSTVTASDPLTESNAAKKAAELSVTPAAAGTEARRLRESAGAGKPTELAHSPASATLPLLVVAADDGEAPKEGDLQTAGVQTGHTLREFQRQRRSTLLHEQSSGALPRLDKKTTVSAEKEAAALQTTVEDIQTLRTKLDDLLGDVVSYGQLRRQRDFDKVAEEYADEEEMPIEGLKVLDRARSDLKKMRDYKNTWINVMVSATVVFLAAAVWFVLLNSPPSHPLNMMARQRRRSEWEAAAVTAAAALLLILFGNWRRTELNQEIYYQELKADRIIFEALAGVRPTEENLLGPSTKEIRAFRRAIEKKVKEEKQEKANKRERRRMRRWWEGV